MLQDLTGVELDRQLDIDAILIKHSNTTWDRLGHGKHTDYTHFMMKIVFSWTLLTIEEPILNVTKSMSEYMMT